MTIDSRVRAMRSGPRSISADTFGTLLAAVKARAAELMEAGCAQGMPKAELQERIMRDCCRRYGAQKISKLPASRAEDALRYIYSWQGGGFA